MGLSTSLIKLLLGLFNLIFCLVNFALTIVFGWEVTRVAQSGIVLIIQFTLLGMTVVFAFGLWITCKRKFLLLKLYTIVLAAFVGVQIFAVIMLAMGSAETEDIANTVFEQLCTATQAATDDAASTLQTHKVAANVDEASWFCCCPKSCDPSTWQPALWDLGVNASRPTGDYPVTAGPDGLPSSAALGAPAVTSLQAFRWPMLTCPTKFAHPLDETRQHSNLFPNSGTSAPCDPAKPGGDPKPCATNPLVFNDDGVTGELAAAMCDDAEGCTDVKTKEDAQHWCGTIDDPVHDQLTCAGFKPTGEPLEGKAGAAESTCKTSVQCVKTWLATKLNLFVVVMSLFLFMEAGMVVGTFQLGRKASEGGR